MNGKKSLRVLGKKHSFRKLDTQGSLLHVSSRSSSYRWGRWYLEIVSDFFKLKQLMRGPAPAPTPVCVQETQQSLPPRAGQRGQNVWLGSQEEHQVVSKVRLGTCFLKVEPEHRERGISWGEGWLYRQDSIQPQPLPHCAGTTSSSSQLMAFVQPVVLLRTPSFLSPPLPVDVYAALQS